MRQTPSAVGSKSGQFGPMWETLNSKRAWSPTKKRCVYWGSRDWKRYPSNKKIKANQCPVSPYLVLKLTPQMLRTVWNPCLRSKIPFSPPNVGLFPFEFPAFRLENSNWSHFLWPHSAILSSLLTSGGGGALLAQKRCWKRVVYLPCFPSYPHIQGDSHWGVLCSLVQGYKLGGVGRKKS